MAEFTSLIQFPSRMQSVNWGWHLCYLYCNKMSNLYSTPIYWFHILFRCSVTPACVIADVTSCVQVNDLWSVLNMTITYFILLMNFTFIYINCIIYYSNLCPSNIILQYCDVLCHSGFRQQLSYLVKYCCRFSCIVYELLWELKRWLEGPHIAKIIYPWISLYRIRLGIRLMLPGSWLPDATVLFGCCLHLHNEWTISKQ